MPYSYKIFIRRELQRQIIKITFVGRKESGCLKSWIKQKSIKLFFILEFIIVDGFFYSAKYHHWLGVGKFIAWLGDRKTYFLIWGGGHVNTV